MVKCLFLLPYLLGAREQKTCWLVLWGFLLKFQPKYYVTLQQIFMKCKAVWNIFSSAMLKQSIHVNYLCLLVLMAVKYYYKIQVIVEVCYAEHCEDLCNTGCYFQYTDF